jgi:hypothetical protein
MRVLRKELFSITCPAFLVEETYEMRNFQDIRTNSDGPSQEHVEMSICYLLNNYSPNVFSRSNTGIVGSNATRDMDVCPRFFCLCCPV